MDRPVFTPEHIERIRETEKLLVPYKRRKQLEAVLTGAAVPDGLTSDERATWDILLGDLRAIYDQAQLRLSASAEGVAD